MTETSKQVAASFALAVAYIDKEFQKRDSKLHEAFRELLTTSLQEAYLELDKKIASLPTPPKFQLPESIVHDANLQALKEELVYQFEQKLDSGLKDVNAHSIKRTNELHLGVDRESNRLESLIGEETEKRRGSVEKLQEALNSHDHDARYAPTSHDHAQYAPQKALDEAIVQVGTTITALEQKAGVELGSLRSNLETSVKLLSEIIEQTDIKTQSELGKLEEEVEARIGKEVLNLEEKVQRSEQTVRLALAVSLEKLEDLIKDTKAGLVKKFYDLDENTKKRFEEIKAVHDRHAKEISRIETDLEKWNREAEESGKVVKAIQKALGEKANVSDILRKADTQKLVKEIRDSIKLPKDGKDGIQWDFEVHPTKKGILRFKRSDKKKWQELTMPLPVIDPYLFSGGGLGRQAVIKVVQEYGGGIGTGFQYTDINGVTYNDRKVYIFDSVTNSSGQFDVDLTGLALTNIYDYRVQSELVPNPLVGPALVMKERFTNAVIEEVNTTHISGTVFRQKQMTTTPGRVTFAMQEAPSGVVVRFTLVAK